MPRAQSGCVEKPVVTGFSACRHDSIGIDIDRPMKYRWAQRINDAFGHLLMRAAASPNETGDRMGGLNHAFKYLYAIRRAGKRLKAWNRTVYYVVEWALFGGIAVADLLHLKAKGGRCRTVRR